MATTSPSADLQWQSQVGRRLKAHRAKAGMTQKELAGGRYSPAYVSTIEAGRRAPSPAALRHFATKLGVEPDELVTGRPPDLGPRLGLSLQRARQQASSGEVASARKVFEQVADEAERFKLPRIKAKAYQGLGLCADRAGDLREAAALYEKAVRILSAEPVTVRVDAITSRAACLLRLGHLRESLYLLEQTLEALESQGLRDPEALGRLHAFLVPAYLDAGLWEKAADAANTALSLAPNVSDPERLAGMYLNLTEAFMRQSRVKDADDSLLRAESLFRQIDLKEEIGYTHHARGYLLARRDDLEQARIELTKALSIYRELRAVIYEADCLNELARVERLAGAPERASDLLRQSFELTAAGHLPAVRAVAYRERALCRGLDESSAREDLSEAIDLFQQAGQSLEMAVSCRLLGDLHAKEGDLAAAAEVFRRGLESVESITS